MTLELGERLYAKTGFGGGHIFPPRYVSLEREGREVTQTMEEAVDELRGALNSDALKEDETFQSYLNFLRSMYPKDRGEDSFPSGWVLTPNINFKFEEDYVGPSVEIMGTSLTGFELAQFTYYILTNTGLETPLDPRVRLLDELRGDRLPDTQGQV